MKYLKILSIFFFCLYNVTSSSQTDLKFGERYVIGASWTYRNGTNSFTGNKYHEWSSSSNAAVNLSPSLYFGLNILYIGKRSKILNGEKTKSRFEMYNAFFQYDFLPEKKSRLFLESSYGISNYCTCGIYDEPGLRKNTSYLGIGAGYDLPIVTNKLNTFSLDLSIISYNILNNIDSKKPFFQYVIGLNANLLKKRKKE